MATIQNDKIEIQITIPRDRLAGPNSSETVEYVAYDLFAALFEYGGELNHRPDGSRVLICNGHHVAQKMSELVRQEWESHLNHESDGGRIVTATIQNGETEINLTVPRDGLTGPDSTEVVQYIAFEFFSALFQYGGEQNRRSDGSRVLTCNGFHVARKMTELVRQEWERHLNPPKENCA